MQTLQQLQQEARFLTNINMLAEMFGCTVRVDMKSHIAYFDGDPEQCKLLSAKLCEVFTDEEVE